MSARTLTLAAPAVVPGLRGPEPIVDITLRVVTPMIGGGYESGKIDPEFPVNGKSIRGHLRFWWRACHAHLYANARDLFEEEAKVWGQAATVVKGSRDASDVWLDVDVGPLENANKVVVARPWWVHAGYPDHALWPFVMGEGDAEVPLQTDGLIDFEFRVHLSSAPGSDVDERRLRQAISAWITFGGVGSRTRRGLGTMFLVNAHDGHSYAWVDQTELGVGQAQVVANPYAPMLRGARYILRNTQSLHVQAWSAAVVQLRNGRHPPAGDARHPTYDREARADLGFPIKGVRPERGINRMASPIIVKALPINETHSRALILCLNAPHISINPGSYSHDTGDGTGPQSIRNLVMNHIKSGWGQNCKDTTL